ncbi:Shedu immune nuclease family protein [Paraburkholderia sediminicola]|uniref:Shedu immune nuclease family protein n=1 Tax=Paraburkholderia sediminicola TaxID=458836 RepID=UPI0038B6B531
MKISDIIYRFPTGSVTRLDGICRVRTFVGTDSRIFALITELDKNTSTSITNCIERVCKSLRERGVVPPECEFIEHYEYNDFRGDTFDMIAFDNSGGMNWLARKQADVELLLGCNSGELNSRTLDQPRLVNDIDRIRNEIDPFIDSPWPEAPDVTRRRSNIESRMISKKMIVDVVESGAGERDIQRLLKGDLSIFAEIYASPQEEYICFSEFPISDGTVDFAVFSGRSRMDVTLIEVKGAEFHLANQGHYDKFSSKIEVAVDQIRMRLRYVIDEIKEFRREVHRIRSNVEQGKAEYNSLLGPIGHLEVSPEKDINIRCVVIGGRTRNDLEESRKRHDLERNTHPSIKVESWDTWLRKVRRG